MADGWDSVRKDAPRQETRGLRRREVVEATEGREILGERTRMIKNMKKRDARRSLKNPKEKWMMEMGIRKTEVTDNSKA